MTLKFGNEIIESEETSPYSGYRPVAEFFVMLFVILVVLAGVTYRASTKSIVINEQAGGLSSDSIFEEDIFTEWAIMPTEKTTDNGNIFVPLPMTAHSDNISVENFYQDHSLLVRIDGLHAVNFENATISGDTDNLKIAAYREFGGEIRISILMDGVYDFDISMDSTQIIITPYKVSEKYDNTILVVSDEIKKVATSEGEAEAKDESDVAEKTDSLSAEITAAIAQMASDIFDGAKNATAESNSEETVGISNEDKGEVTSKIIVAEYRSDEEVILFAKECGADIVVFLDTAVSDDPEKYGLCAAFNGNYFIPEMDNAHLTEIFLRNIAVSSKNRANTIDIAPEGSILYDIDVPSTIITVGYTSNPNEGKYLTMENYQRTIAEGIVNAVKEVIEK